MPLAQAFTMIETRVAPYVGAVLVSIGSLLIATLWIPYGIVLMGILICGLIEALRRTRKREQSAQISERCTQRRFERLFDASPLPLSLSTLEDRKVVAVNDAYLKMFGV